MELLPPLGERIVLFFVIGFLLGILAAFSFIRMRDRDREAGIR